MNRTFRLMVIATLLVAGLATSAAAEGVADARSAVIAERVMEALGGADAWQATRFVRFNFFGFRTHHWDRYSGRHRLEGKTQDGDEYVVLHDVNSREGRAWLNGEELEGDTAAEWLKRAYGAWINDVYWLVMPYKLRDPGVTLAYDGEEELDGQVYDKLLLTFADVGLTPGDRYWAYINRDTGLMDRWAYHLEGWEAEREATHWKWLDWGTYGGIQLSARRINPADEREATLGDIAVFDHLDDAVFTSPDPLE